MLMDFDTLVDVYNLRIEGVLHCGAHLGEEAEEYQRHGIDKVWWIEANPDLMPALLEHVGPYGHRAFNALLREKDGVLTTMHVTNDTQHSSVLEFGTVRAFAPHLEVVRDIALPCCSLDSLLRDVRSLDPAIFTANMLVMGLQGAEGVCLLGAIETLPRIDYVYSEVYRADVYEGATRVEDIDDFLGRWGLRRVQTLWVAPRETGEQGWGDALWVKEGL
jgi:hypothetical protein